MTGEKTASEGEAGGTEWLLESWRAEVLGKLGNFPEQRRIVSLIF